MNALLMAILRALGIALYHVGLARLVIHLNRKQPKVLLYHSVEPAESDFTRGLDTNVTPKAFARQLAFVQRHYRIIALDRLLAGDAPERAVVITFDDGYRSVHRHALPLLAAARVPAVMYVVARAVGNEAMVWVNEMLWLLRNGPPEARRAVCRDLDLPATTGAPAVVARLRSCYTGSRAEALLSDLRSTAGVDALTLARRSRLYLDWSEIDEMRERGFAFGSHTITHPSLPRLGRDEQMSELADSRAQLARRLGAVDSLAYPFGDHSAETRRIALDAGYRSMMEVGGVNDPLDPRRVARVQITAATVAGFFAELEVATPLKALLQRWVGRRARA
jgi:peptidoglycan/xylan/chitin deacetylase (PgdA/CDA1 family)